MNKISIGLISLLAAGMIIPAASTAMTTSGGAIKVADDGNPATTADSAVYFHAEDGKRYVFPNAKTYHTWFGDFAAVKQLTAAEIAAIPLGGNVTYRAGTRLIKITTDPKVYVVEPGGTLRWLSSESIARELYGSEWMKRVDDVPDAFFVNYQIGNPLTTATLPEGTIVRTPDGAYYLIENGAKRLITADAMTALGIRQEFVLEKPSLAAYPSGTTVASAEKTIADPSHKPTKPTTPPSSGGGSPSPAPSPTPTPEPTPTPTPTPAPAPTGYINGPTSIHPIGPIPAALSGIAMPAQPQTTRTVNVSTAADFNREAAVTGTHVVVTAPIAGAVSVDASDIRVTMASGASLGDLTIWSSAKINKRIALVGGRYRSITLFQAVQYWPSVVTYPDRMLEDVTIDGVTAGSASDSSIGIVFRVTGHRVAIVRSSCRAQKYCIYADDGSTGDAALRNTDILVAGNDFRTAGVESNVRLIDVERAVVVDNRLESDSKHNYRIHGRSDLLFAARNVLVDAGVMFATLEGDDVGQVWFENNTFYHTMPDLFNPDRNRLEVLRAKDNLAYTDVWGCFYCYDSLPAGWELSNNRVEPYRPPPTP